jgi:hypothetical protein
MSSAALIVSRMNFGTVSTPAYETPSPSNVPESPSAPPVEQKKSNHQANIVKIDEIIPHPDPDTTSLELIVIGGYQVVVRKGQFKAGDFAVYIQPDSVVPQTDSFKFLWEQYVGVDGTVPEKRRRITVRKFRGQWSEGLLLPITDFGWDQYGEEIHRFVPQGAGFIFEQMHAGDDVSTLLGITHYVPETDLEAATFGKQSAAPRRKYPKTIKGLWYMLLSKLGFKKAHKNYVQEVSFVLPEYDVEAFKNHANTFTDGELVIITEKIHGSNARFVCIDGEMYTGSRSQWKSADGDNVWTRAVKEIPWIGAWCRNHPGYALYGEVTPTQKGYLYGSEKVQFFLFDILTPEGKWVPKPDFATVGIVPFEGRRRQRPHQAAGRRRPGALRRSLQQGDRTELRGRTLDGAGREEHP